MLFQHNTFCPESVPDERTRAVLRSAADSASDLVRPSDVLTSAIRQGDSQVLAILVRALRAGCSLSDLLKTMAACRVSPSVGPAVQRTRQSFTPQALKALDEFDEALCGGGHELKGVALEVLLHFARQKKGTTEKEQKKSAMLQ